MKRLACCRRRTKDFSLDFDEQDGVTTYYGLESCILNNASYENESAGEVVGGADVYAGATDSLDEDASSCSSKDAFASSFSSQCLSSSKQEDQHLLDEWDTLNSSLNSFCIKGKAPIMCSMDIFDVEPMKEKFAMLLLGEDVSGGAKGISAALALSHAITNLAASTFRELWKLEPLSEERKSKWFREMDWLLSPTNYMVELVPAKQNSANGRILEIMTPTARSDVHVTLPALKKLDSMLIEILDCMVNTEFWYAEVGSREDGDGYRGNIGTRRSKKWWMPSPRVPDTGLSPSQRRHLGLQAKFVHQILKAAKSINERVLVEIPIPSAIKDALPKKSGKTSLGVHIYPAISAVSIPVEEVLLSLNVDSEHAVLDMVNRLEGAIFAWKQRISDESSVKKSPIRYPWSFVKENVSEAESMAVYLERAEAFLRLLKIRFPNLPQSFIDVTKIQYNKDVGHSIIEAYSRALVGLAFSILTRIGDVLQEDDVKKPTTPIANLKFDFSSDVYLAGITETPPGHIKRSLIKHMNMVDDRLGNSFGKLSAEQFPETKAKGIAVLTACSLRSKLLTTKDKFVRSDNAGLLQVWR